MKKVLKGVALALGIPALILALFAWHMVGRAKASIEAFEAELTTDIAALRDRQLKRPRVLADWPPYQESLKIASVAGHTLPSYKPIHRLLNTFPGFPYEAPDTALVPTELTCTLASLPDIVLVGLALIQDHLRGGGSTWGGRRDDLERQVIREMLWSLTTDAHSAQVLADLAERVDLLEANRPTLAEIFDEDYAIARRLALDVLQNHNNDRGHLTEPPGWKSLFFWRVHLSRILNQFSYIRGKLHALERLEGWDLQTEADKLQKTLADSGSLPPLQCSLRYAGKICDEELFIRCDWALLRTATAIARFKAEEGRLPSVLEELLPRFLKSIPRSPISGLPPDYQQGELFFKSHGGYDRDPWAFRQD